MKFFVWCRASPNDRRGYKDSVAHAYSESVRRQLYGIPVPDPLNAPVSEWVAACKEYEDQILGVLLCEFSCSPDFMTLLSPHQREIRSYWCATDFSDDPLCFVKVVDLYDDECNRACACHRATQRHVLQTECPFADAPGGNK